MIKLKKSDALYQQIANYFEKEIVEGRLVAGDKIPATTQLATRFQVNSDTIQQSLKLLMKRGLVERAPGRGTYVRRGVSSKTVGIIFGKEIYLNPDRMFFSIYLDRLTKLLGKKGWNSKLFPTSEFAGYDKAFYDMKSAVDSGEIRAVVEFCSNTLVRNWVEKECPVPFSQHFLTVDYADFTLSGLNYLFNTGCRKISLLAHEVEGNLPIYEKAVRDFCLDKGIAENDIRIIPTNSYADDGYQAIKDLYKQGENPDGLLVANDGVCRGALYALLELGVKIPDEIKLITYANQGIDIFCHIPLTKLEVNPKFFVEQVYDEIIAKINGKKPTYTPTKATLVPGRSCGESD